MGGVNRMWVEPEPRGVRAARGAGSGEQCFLEEGVLKAESEEDGLHSKERDREACLVSSLRLVPEMCGVGARGGGRGPRPDCRAVKILLRAWTLF